MSNLRLIKQIATESNISSVSLEDVFSSDYDIYKVTVAQTTYDVSNTDVIALKIRFIEDIPQRFSNPPSTTEFIRFNVFGVKPGVNGSFIRNVNLTADLSNDFATMISIGAQANSNQVSGNATAFSNYNAGLKDSIIPEKESSFLEYSSKAAI